MQLRQLETRDHVDEVDHRPCGRLQYLCDVVEVGIRLRER